MAMKISKDPRVKKLVAAAGRGDLAEVEDLLAQGADPNAYPPDSLENGLWAALYARNMKVIRVLASAKKVDLNDGFPHSPLTFAAHTGNVELIRVLAEAGADVNKPAASDETPLLVAVSNNKLTVAKELVGLGADPNLAPTKKKHETITNYSPLEYAAMNGKKKMLEVLRAAPTAGNSKQLSATLLCAAAGAGKIAEVKKLIEQEGVAVNARDAQDKTPLICAAEQGRTVVLKYLLERGADVNEPGGREKNSPLMAAAAWEKPEAVKLLLDAGAKVDYGVQYERRGPLITALELAREIRNKKIIELLLEAKKKQRGKISADAAQVSGPRGVSTFDTNDAVVLVAADVPAVAEAFSRRLGARTTWRKDALGESVKLTGRCYAVWKLAGSPWTTIMKLHCADFAHWPRADDAKALSKSLHCRAIYVANSDTAGVTQYMAFDDGNLVELFDYGSTDGDKPSVQRFAKAHGLDIASLPNISAADSKLFASSLRKLDVKKIKNDLDFVNDYIKREQAYVPFGLDHWSAAGKNAELMLEDLAPQNIERLDYLAAG